MKVEINRTIDEGIVTLFSHKTGKFIDEIPSESLKELKHLGGGVFDVTRKKINEIKQAKNERL